MIDFQRIDLANRDAYNQFLQNCGERGCEYSLANLTMWGRQRAAFLKGYLALFSQFQRSSVYPFPIGNGDLKAVLDEIIQDARQRGIICRITGLTAQDCMALEELYPGQFQFHPDRDGCDYVYSIDDLADLKGRKFQKKRNHLNKFWQTHPNATLVPIDAGLLPKVQDMAAAWYAGRVAENGNNDYHLEQRAIGRAFRNMDALGMEGVALMEEGEILAFAMGSHLTRETFDVHFEKALETVDGAYAAINQGFAALLRDRHPQLVYLNREDDMGLPGLRKAKLSYNPHHLITKFWARLWEADDED